MVLTVAGGHAENGLAMRLRNVEFATSSSSHGDGLPDGRNVCEARPFKWHKY